MRFKVVNENRDTLLIDIEAGQEPRFQAVPYVRVETAEERKERKISESVAAEKAEWHRRASLVPIRAREAQGKIIRECLSVRGDWVQIELPWNDYDLCVASGLYWQDHYEPGVLEAHASEAKA
jgi:hypothetical protein